MQRYIILLFYWKYAVIKTLLQCGLFAQTLYYVSVFFCLMVIIVIDNPSPNTIHANGLSTIRIIDPIPLISTKMLINEIGKARNVCVSFLFSNSSNNQPLKIRDAPHPKLIYIMVLKLLFDKFSKPSCTSGVKVAISCITPIQIIAMDKTLLINTSFVFIF